ncbi:flagellar basal body P-ring formation chaperone FlgA [Oceanibium sediminis]|uniref:flagellar basal body P-ring formation chaperone FlgA n=1 Tax=Oceanibium sediminis TaxID=2026339 RepID=UPI00280AC138|nr:flagellar basal body P-ring formation chaperone FlgA [Oceanibium sediminis]
MMRAVLLALGLGAVAWPAFAQSLIAARTVPVRSVISAGDLALSADTVPGALSRIEDAVGQEAAVPLYAGRPVRAGDLTPAALVDRNDIVTLKFTAGALLIETDGRALDRAAEGEKVRVMNLASRLIVVGRISAPGVVEVNR